MKYIKRLHKKQRSLLIILILCISIGFAYLSTQLNIIGNVSVLSNKWDVHFENVQVKAGSVAGDIPIIDEDKTSVTFTANLNKPGDYYEFTVDAVNAGTIDAMIDTISNFNLTDNQKKYLETSVTYVEGEQVETKQELLSGNSASYKIRVGYKKNISVSDLPNDDEDLVLTYSVTYVQKDDTSIQRLADMLDINIYLDDENQTLSLGDLAIFNVDLSNISSREKTFNLRSSDGMTLSNSSVTIASFETTTITVSRTITEKDIINGYFEIPIEATYDGVDFSLTETETFRNLEESNGHLFISLEELNPKSEYLIGDYVVHKVTIINDGNLTLNNIKLTCECNGNIINIGSLAPGISYETEVSYMITESDTAEGEFTFVFNASGIIDDLNNSNVYADPAENIVSLVAAD